MVLEHRFSAPEVPAEQGDVSTPPPAAPPVEPESSVEPEPNVEPFVEPEPNVEPIYEPTLEAAPEPASPPGPSPVQAAPPPPVQAPPAPTPAASPAPTQNDLETRTMAELYATQGHLDQAIEVYEKLAARRPEETTYRIRLDELKMLHAATRQAQKAPPQSPPPSPPAAPSAPAEGGDKTLEVLSGWLDAIKKSKES
jgi:hypothetical protein